MRQGRVGYGGAGGRGVRGRELGKAAAAAALSQALVSPETRKFTRVLSKPGMAAELWQSIFEVVQGSMFVARPSLSGSTALAGSWGSLGVHLAGAGEGTGPAEKLLGHALRLALLTGDTTQVACAECAEILQLAKPLIAGFTPDFIPRSAPFVPGFLAHKHLGPASCTYPAGLCLLLLHIPPRVTALEAKGKKRFTGKNGKAPQRKHKFKKDNDSGPPNKFHSKGGEEGKPKFRPKKSEKGNKKLGKTSMKQFKSKQQPEKFTRKRKLQEGNEGGSALKKLKWNDFKKKKKELKQSRQLNDKTNYDIIIKSKQIWESMRRKCCDKKKRQKQINELHKLLQGKIKTMVFAYDSTRVIQCFIQYGNDKQRQETFEELKDSLLELSKSKYSRNIVKKFLMYGTKPQVVEIIKSFKGEVKKKMFRHSEPSAVVQYAYNDKAILEQRNMLTEELYGNTFQVYKSPVHPTLDKVLEAHPEKQEAMMDEMKQILTPMAQKEAVIKHSLVHKVFLDFFIHALPKQRSEMLEAIREAVICLAHTHDGA
nr:pumilio homolog 3-like [Chelonoidis abingdonii]